ncbi:MAG: glucohydrolase, partial [Selenomonadaceae bacterium]|nr:glucohydrolase [Selenomonadaceae bacterium]
MACGRIFEAEALWMMARDGVLQYHDILRASGRSEDETMKIIGARSRDNGRTPMQWTAGESAGFTTGTPWLGVNRNHAV